MPKVYPSPVSPSVNGTAVTYTAPTAGAGNGDAVRTNNVLALRNGATASSLTILFGATVDGQTVASKQVTIPANGDLLVGPFTGNMPQQSGTDVGLVYVEYANVTTLTRALLVSPF